MIWNSVLQNMSAGRKRRESAGKRTGKRRRSAFAAALLGVSAAIIAAGCAGTGRVQGDTESSEHLSEDGRISVVTTIFPPYDFVREIAGETVDLKMLLKPGEETHSYEPTPQDIIAIQNCDVFIYTGGENDVWVEDILSAVPESDMMTLRLDDCVETVEEEEVEGMKGSAGHSHSEASHDEDAHAEDAHDEHAEESVHEIDEHVWTSPVNASLIVERIKDVLSQADPSRSALYEENALSYQEELKELDSRVREVVSDAKRDIMIFGDRFPFRYFADEYGLDYYAAFPGCAGDTEPSAATMVFLIEKVREEKVPAVLKMELSNDDIANAIAEATGTEVKVFYSCHNLSADDFENGETYLSMMQKNVETLKEVLN